MLIIGILFLAILLIFSTTIFTKVRYFINFGTNATIREQVRHVAEAGIDYAAREIANDSSYAGTGGTFVDVGNAGNFEVIVDPSSSQNLKTVTVTGYAPKTPGHKTKTKIRIDLKPSDAISADLLVQGVRDNAVVVSNGYVYSFGGRQDGCTLPTNPPYPLAPSDVQFAKIEATGYLGTFGETLKLPETRADAGGVEGASGYIYVIGGVAGCDPADERSTVYFTKPEPTGEITFWNTAINPIPTAGTVRYAFFTNGYIYVIQDQAIYYASQNPGTGEVGPWQTDSISAPDNWPSYIFTDGYLYYISGPYTRNVWYTPVNGGSPISSFTLIPNVLPATTTESAIAAAANGYIYVMGGRLQYEINAGAFGNKVVQSVYYAQIKPDHSLFPFSTSPKLLPQPRWSPITFSATAINNKLFVFGGLSGGSGTTHGNVWAADIIGPYGEIGNWTDNGGPISYSGWALDKATYIYK